jgi:hypothetical protein
MRRAGFLAVIAAIFVSLAVGPEAARAGSAHVAALQVALRAVGLSPGRRGSPPTA